MKLPIIEYAVMLDDTLLATSTSEDDALRFLRLVEAAPSHGVTLAGVLGLQTIKREIEVADVADVDVRSLDTTALATAYDEVQVTKAAVREAALVKMAPAMVPVL